MTPVSVNGKAMAVSEADTALRLLTLAETARELRCSRAQLHHILSGRVADLPPLPVLRIGRRAFVRSCMLEMWVRELEVRERERNYASGCFGPREDQFEYIAGA